MIKILAVAFLTIGISTSSALAETGPVFDITAHYVGETDSTDFTGPVDLNAYTSPGGEVDDDYVPEPSDETFGEPGIDDSGNVGE